MPASRPPALRILFLAANPTSTEWLRLDHEAKEIDRKIRSSPHRDSIVVEACWGATADDLQRILLERAPHIVHFSGHGQMEGLQLEAAPGRAALATPEALAGLLRIVNRDTNRVRVVVLNSCHSASQLAALCEVVDCAIGMSAGIDDHAAAAFASAFYQAVGAGRSMRDAFELARNRLQLDWPGFADVPQMWAREGGVAASALVLLPPSGGLVDAPHGVETSGRWLTGHDLKAGDSLAEGRFVLKEWLGQGTFATVWRAHESNSGRDVALKILQERYAGDAVIQDRFFRGARLMSQFKHTAIVEVLEPYVMWHGYRFFVMEFVRGRTLMEYVAEHRLEWRTVVTYGLEVGDALTYAHERSCIHRDIKPTNILVDPRGHARLFDFDLVRDMYVEGGTRPGAMGTVAYAAPEALDRPQDTDGRSDEYSLAMTIACTIAGHEPSRKDKRDPAAFIATLPCPRPIRDVLKKAAALEPSDRYSSMLGFCAALKEAVAQHDAAVRRKQVAVRALWMSASGITMGLGLGYAVWLNSAAGTAAPTPSPAGPPPATTPTSVPTPTASPAPPPAGDARLDDVLRIDRTRAAYTIRLSADNTLGEARMYANAVLQTGRFQPWIVHKIDGDRLFYVFVGAYESRYAAEQDHDAVRAIRNRGVMIRGVRDECPTLTWNDGGYYDCA